MQVLTRDLLFLSLFHIVYALAQKDAGHIVDGVLLGPNLLAVAKQGIRFFVHLAFAVEFTGIA